VAPRPGVAGAEVRWPLDQVAHFPSYSEGVLEALEKLDLTNSL